MFNCLLIRLYISISYSCFAILGVWDDIGLLPTHTHSTSTVWMWIWEKLEKSMWNSYLLAAILTFTLLLFQWMDGWMDGSKPYWLVRLLAGLTAHLPPSQVEGYNSSSGVFLPVILTVIAQGEQPVCLCVYIFCAYIAHVQVWACLAMAALWVTCWVFASHKGLFPSTELWSAAIYFYWKLMAREWVWR